MAEEKKSFILYCDWITIFEKLSDQEAGVLAKHLFRYVNDKNPESPDRMTDILFEPIKLQLKRDLRNWELKKKKRSDAGKKGMEKRWKKDSNDTGVITKDNNVINPITKITVTDTVTGTVNVTGNTSINSSTIEKKDITSTKKKINPKPPVFGFTGCMEIYNDWIISITGIGGKINDVEGKALKQIINYLRTQISNAGKDASEEAVHKAFKFILINRDRWDKYHQDKLKITEINSNLINIINAVKNGTVKQKADNSFSESLSELRKEGSI